MKGKIFFSLIIWLVVFSKAVLAANSIERIRWSDNGRMTRIVIETISKPNYVVKPINDNSIDIEFPAAISQKMDLRRNLNNHPANIRKVSIGKISNKVIINFRFRSKMLYKAFVINKEKYPYYRLVIDIKPTLRKNTPSKGEVNVSRVELYKEVPKRPAKGSNTKNSINKKSQNKANNVVKLPIILIDPGHGGKDVGAIGRSTGIYEKNVTLKYSLALKRHLEAKKKYKVYITRDKDEFVSLSKRLEMASLLKADLFISIHADSNKNPKLRGLSVYTLSEKASDLEAENLAKHENDVTILGDIDYDKSHGAVSMMLLDMIYHKKQNYAMLFAETIIKELSKHVKLLNHSHRYANFKVLRNKHIPSVLIELGYLTNKYEEKLLASDIYRDKLVNSISESIDHFFRNFYKN